MSRWSSLYQALAKASRNASRSTAKRREIFSYAGSNRRARSVVSMVGRCFVDASWASGTVSSASLATHWWAPAGDLGELPLEAEEVLEEAVAPAGRGVGPRHLETAGDGVAALARAVAAVPAQTLRLDRGALGLGADVVAGRRAVGLAERVAACDQGDGLLVVHGHPAERLADVVGREQRVGIAARTLGVDVDQPHLDGAERTGQLRVRRCSARRPARCPPLPRRSPRAPKRPRARTRSRRSRSPCPPVRRCRRARAGRPTRSSCRTSS